MSWETTELQRRVVSQISEYPEPKDIFKMVTEREWPYSTVNQASYSCRDRAMMSFAYASGGRITAVVGGYKLQSSLPEAHNEDEELICVVCGRTLRGSQRKFCSHACRSVNWKNIKVVGKHEGLKRENIEVRNDFVVVKTMEVVKRSEKVLQKYGRQAGRRDPFVIPLKTGLYENPFWDQLVPFAWLIVEFLSCHAPEKGELFGFKRGRALQIIQTVTKMYPNWFRAQAEHFYGHFLLTDTVKLAKFLKVQDPKQIKHYIGYSWTEQLKDKQQVMDFNWIEQETTKIKRRM